MWPSSERRVVLSAGGFNEKGLRAKLEDDTRILQQEAQTMSPPHSPDVHASLCKYIGH